MIASHRLLRLTVLGFTLTPLCGWSQDADLHTMDTIAADFQSKVHVRGIPDSAFLPPPKVRIYTLPPFSYYEKGTVTEGRFGELPPPVQQSINQWATFTSDQATGEALFHDMFYRFFFVHELGHWVQHGVLIVRQRSEGKLPDAEEDFYQGEVQSNRIAVAWWREHDPKYIARMVADFREIESHLRCPVPTGQDKIQYFIENYTKLGNDPEAYGWYQLDLVLTAYDQPKESLQSVLDGLATVRYKRLE
jgi:hypothetical protein